MNQREAKAEYGIPHFTYTNKFLEASRELDNLVRNLERAIERISNRGKTN